MQILNKSLLLCADLHCDGERRGDRCQRQRPAVRSCAAGEPHRRGGAGPRLRWTSPGEDEYF